MPVLMEHGGKRIQRIAQCLKIGDRLKCQEAVIENTLAKGFGSRFINPFQNRVAIRWHVGQWRNMPFTYANFCFPNMKNLAQWLVFRSQKAKVGVADEIDNITPVIAAVIQSVFLELQDRFDQSGKGGPCKWVSHGNVDVCLGQVMHDRHECAFVRKDDGTVRQ